MRNDKMLSPCKLWFPSLKVEQYSKGLFLFFLLCLQGAVIDQVTGAEITGSLILPSGHTAVEGGISVTISFHHSLGYTGNNGYEPDIFLPHGSSTVPFSLTVPDDGPSCSWQLEYTLPNNDDGYINRGYYHKNGPSLYKSTLLPCGQDHAGIDITLIPAKNITGILSSPGNKESTEHKYITIWASQANPHSTLRYNARAILYAYPETYSLKVPDVDEALWEVRYDYDKYYNGNEFIPTGYYSSSSSTPIQSDAILLQGGRNHSNIDLTLLKGVAVRGTVTGTPTQGKGIRSGSIYAIDVNNLTYSSSAYIESGFYRLNLPDVAGASWRISYQYGCIEMVPKIRTVC